jgi:hypothetical protein
MIIVQIESLELAGLVGRILSLTVAGGRLNYSQVRPHHFTLLPIGGRHLLLILVLLASKC